MEVVCFDIHTRSSETEEADPSCSRIARDAKVAVPAGGTGAIFGMVSSLEMTDSMDRPSLRFRVARVGSLCQVNYGT
jgi:hypothetical protein